jgi:hypothetical protein
MSPQTGRVRPWYRLTVYPHFSRTREPRSLGGYQLHAGKVRAIAADVSGKDRPLHDRGVRTDKEVG